MKTRFDRMKDLIARASKIRLSPDGVGYELEFGPRPSVEKKIRKLTLREWWLQQYVSANGRKLGLSRIRGPFETGPDFHLRYRGSTVWAEVETHCRKYVDHRHHLDPNFTTRVVLLIVLDERLPPPALRKLLPPTILRVDRDHFTRWYRAADRDYARKKALTDTERVKEAIRRSQQMVVPERRFHALPCHQCGQTIVCAGQIERGFSSYEPVVCPNCGGQIGEIRSDIGSPEIIAKLKGIRPGATWEGAPPQEYRAAVTSFFHRHLR